MVKIKGLNTKIVSVDLDKLKLDLTNVRYQHKEKIIDDKKMGELSWNEPGTKELSEQIKSTRGLYEEPIIDSQNVVLEGNRRVVCLRRLKIETHKGKLPGIKKNTFDIIKCKMILANTSDLAKHLYLATVHVKSKLPWTAFNKAKEISNLSNMYDVSYDKLAKHLAMGKVTLIRMVRSYEQTYKYGKKYPEDQFWYRKYTYFEELFKKRDLKEFNKIQQNVDKFAKWVHEDKFRDVRDVRILAQIMGDSDALKLFETHGLAEALKLLENKNPALKSREFKQIQKTIDLIRFFPRKELIKTVSDSRRRAIILKLKKEVDSLMKDIDMFDKEQ